MSLVRTTNPHRQVSTLIETACSRDALMQVDYLTQHAMTGQTLLSKWADLLAGSDPLLHDELRAFVTIARIAKAQVIADAAERALR